MTIHVRTRSANLQPSSPHANTWYQKVEEVFTLLASVKVQMQCNNKMLHSYFSESTEVFFRKGDEV